MSHINRRSFLVGASAFLGSQLLIGCGSDKNLKVLLLEESLPPLLIRAFVKQFKLSAKFNFKPIGQLQELFDLLLVWQNPKKAKSSKKWLLLPNQKVAQIPDLVTLGDYWLAPAIQKQLISPIPLANLDGWQNLPISWQNLVKRNLQGNLDEQGLIWGAPYRWGSTVLAYRSDKFEALGWQPSDWSDLWRTELSDRISLLDQPREVIGLTLKKLGYSYNTNDLDSVPNLKSELLALQKQVKFYDSTDYLQPLILGDTWLAVGWSDDVLPIVKRYPNIKAIIPKSGSALWADIWVIPKYKSFNGDRFQAIQEWINFCWQPKSANLITLFTNGSSPSIFNIKDQDISVDIKENAILFPSPEILEKSEFLLPLNNRTEQQYKLLWKTMRTSKINRQQ